VPFVAIDDDALLLRSTPGPALRDLLEQGFEGMVVADATAGPRHPEWGDGYAAA
jgi:hypothetical protein